MLQQPVYLVTGHITRDMLDTGWRFGGTAAYASLAARRLGVQARVVTAHADDVDPTELFHGIEHLSSPSTVTTTFRNDAKGDDRVQTLLSQGSPLSITGVDQAWRKPEILHLAPVMGEVGLTFSSSFAPNLYGATVQGWLRSAQQPGGLVTFGTQPGWRDILAMLDIAVYSDSDLHNNLRARDVIRDIVPVCVETLGRRGCLIVESGREYPVAVDPIDCVDATGAGDVFAAAFFVTYYRTGDSLFAAKAAGDFVKAVLLDPGFRAPLAAPTEPVSD